MKRGFIQIPILIAIIAGVLVLGGAGYWGVHQYNGSQQEKIAKEKAAQVQAESQQKELTQAQVEIEKLKEQAATSEKNQKAIDQKIATKPSITEITANELSPYLSGVVQIDCGTELGSGSLWNLPGIGYGVLTNKHVVKSPRKLADNSKNWSCLVRARDKDGLADEGTYDLDFTNWWKWNDISDISFVKIEVNAYLDTQDSLGWSKPIEKLNYAISSLRKCPAKTAINSPVVIIGYPAYALKQANGTDSSYSLSSRISTNGIISGYDNSVILPPQNLSNPNYYVSAKIDSGNSGGIAFSKDAKGLCVLGIPTWLTVGVYETQGLIQDIHNVMQEK